jgi:spore coat polysaccharide biosynthesis predicted glycosyltransferase SpsG
LIKIALICSGGVELGYGHLIRAISFVKDVPKEFDIRLFPIIDFVDQHLFNGVSQKVVICDNYFSALENILKFKPDVVIWDTVDCDNEFFIRLKKTQALQISISPIFSHMAKIDILFTRGEALNLPKNVKVFNGLKYAIIKNNCFRISNEKYNYNLSKPHLSIGISMGGSDAANTTQKILKKVVELPTPLTIYLILGEGYQHSYKDLVDTTIHHNHEVILSKTNRSMWDILSNCCLTILAGGITTVEAVYAGMPSISIFENNNKLADSPNKILFTNKASLPIVEDVEGDFIELKKSIMVYNNSRELLKKARENTKGLINKMAPTEIYKEILNGFKI